MSERWTFGESPLPQTEAAAGLLRRVTSLVLALEAEDPAVDELLADLERAAHALGSSVPSDPAPRVGDRADGDGRVYLDHARDVGAFNPCVPAYELSVDGDHAGGTVSFPIAYEGPPGIVHGGFLALFFDCVVQQHNCDLGEAGKTTSLTLRYRRPAPLLTPLEVAVQRSAGDGRIRSTARLTHGERVLCEAEVEAIAGNRDDLPAVSPRRSAR
jgi:hypothetical protein